MLIPTSAIFVSADVLCGGVPFECFLPFFNAELHVYLFIVNISSFHTCIYAFQGMCSYCGVRNCLYMNYLCKIDIYLMAVEVKKKGKG